MNRNVTLRQFRVFLAVAQERSFTRAAARLRLTQRALTLSIKTLEAEVGVKLLDRTTRSVVPTVQGERFIVVAERLIEEMERALDDLWAHAERQRGLVVVAATASLISHAFAPALGTLARRHPGISVRIVEEHTAGAGDTLGWGVLRDYPTLGLSAESGIRTLIERHAGGAFVLQRPRYEVSSVSGLQSLVEQGLGVATMPALAAMPMTRADLVFRLLVPAVHRVVYLARQPGRSPTPAASALVAVLLERLEGLAGGGIEVLAGAAGLARFGFELAPSRPSIQRSK